MLDFRLNVSYRSYSSVLHRRHCGGPAVGFNSSVKSWSAKWSPSWSQICVMLHPSMDDASNYIPHVSFG